MRSLVLAAALAAIVPATPSLAVTIHSEGVNGDLSNNQNAPTNAGTLAAAVSSVIGASVNVDRDFITFTVPVGFVLTSIKLAAYTSTDDLGFMALDSGGTVSSLTDVSQLLGYVHFGPGPGGSPLNSNTLVPMSTSAGAQGFTVPLPAGQYTLWVQQTNAQNIAYQFDLTIVPEPASAGLVALGLACLALTRRVRA